MLSREDIRVLIETFKKEAKSIKEEHLYGGELVSFINNFELIIGNIENLTIPYDDFLNYQELLKSKIEEKFSNNDELKILFKEKIGVEITEFLNGYYNMNLCGDIENFVTKKDVFSEMTFLQMENYCKTKKAILYFLISLNPGKDVSYETLIDSISQKIKYYIRIDKEAEVSEAREKAEKTAHLDNFRNNFRKRETEREVAKANVDPAKAKVDPNEEFEYEEFEYEEFEYDPESESDFAKIKTNLPKPTIATNLPRVKANLPVMSTNLHTITTNLPTITTNLPRARALYETGQSETENIKIIRKIEK